MKIEAGAMLTCLLIMSGCAIQQPQKEWHQVPRPIHSVTPAPTVQTPTSNVPNVRRAGSFCSPVGSKAKTASGSPMTCIHRPGEEQARWRVD